MGLCLLDECCGRSGGEVSQMVSLLIGELPLQHFEADLFRLLIQRDWVPRPPMSVAQRIWLPLMTPDVW